MNPWLILIFTVWSLVWFQAGVVWGVAKEKTYQFNRKLRNRK